jgi:flavin-dependent dehydrogenase
MDASDHHRFAKLRAARLDLSDTEILNSNNKLTYLTEVDVAVVGAGINGLSYAIQVKKERPHLNVAVFEKSPAPCYKIGESTLSSFSRFVNGAMVPVDYLFRLFALKDGLQFYCIDEKDIAVTSEDVGGHDVSFQMDRRASELFFTMWAQKMGIHVVHGADANFEVKVSCTGTAQESLCILT